MHSRSSWTSRAPKRTIAVDGDHIKGVCVHYAGFDIAPDRSTATLLASIQRGHMDNLGWYDIAYSVAVDQAGVERECRGYDVENGAQGGRRLNRSYVAVVALLGPGQVPSSHMELGITSVVSHVRAKWPHAVEVVPHSELKATSCPGDPLRALIAAGHLSPAVVAPSSALIAPPPLSKLRRGSKGRSVSRLQVALGITADGKFGPQTEGRLTEVQKTLTPWLGHYDGVCGPKTWAFVEWTETIYP